MNAPTETLLTPEGDPFNYAAFHGYDAPAAERCNGWSPARQRTFLEALSEGHSVAHACRIVGLSKQSAYALRASARGAGFRLGWDAAQLLCRNALADELMDRALHGVRETVEQDDGRTVTRHRHDNRPAMAMLTRLDKAADAARGAACDAAARLVAADFEPYLDLIGRDAGPARAGLFLGARAEAAMPDDLEPVRALARADKWLRTHTDLAGELDTSDLDPARRADWTAEQWLRAEAAGLLVLAPASPEPGPEPKDARDGNGQFGQLDPRLDPDGPPVWWDDVDGKYRTRFPPADDFCGKEYGEYGDYGYSREVSPEEEEAVEAPRLARIEQSREIDARARDIWFGFIPDPETPESDRAERAEEAATAPAPCEIPPDGLS